MKHKREREEACSICGHYHDYEGGEACLVCGHSKFPTENKPVKPASLPAEILQDFLFLGSYDLASRAELLKTLGISHILNTVPKCQVLYKNSFTYHTSQETPPPFEDSFSFLDSVKQDGRKVLVYCMSGISRSPAIVIGYLMKVRNWRLTESYKWVKDKWRLTVLNEEDVARLEALELSLFGRASTDFRFALSMQSQPGPAGSMFHWGGEHQHAESSGSASIPQPTFQLGNGAPAGSFLGQAQPAPGQFVFGQSRPAEAPTSSEMEM